MSKFKVGDKVRVRDDLIVGKIYSEVTFNKFMDEYKGHIYEIEEISELGNYRINDWFFSEEMLESFDIIDNINYANALIQDLIKNNKTVFDKIELNYTIKAKQPILDDVEKEYLRNVIKPFRDRVINIYKKENLSEVFEFIVITSKGLCHITEMFSLPYFKKNTMYKGMELDRYYTLEELGL